MEGLLLTGPTPSSLIMNNNPESLIRPIFGLTWGRTQSPINCSTGAHLCVK